MACSPLRARRFSCASCRSWARPPCAGRKQGVELQRSRRAPSTLISISRAPAGTTKKASVPSGEVSGVSSSCAVMRAPPGQRTTLSGSAARSGTPSCKGRSASGRPEDALETVLTTAGAASGAACPACSACPAGSCVVVTSASCAVTDVAMPQDSRAAIREPRALSFRNCIIEKPLPRICLLTGKKKGNRPMRRSSLFVRQSIFSLIRFSLQTIRPVVSLKKRVFPLSSSRAAGGAGRFSKLKRSKNACPTSP